MSLWGLLMVTFKVCCHYSGFWLLAPGFRRLQDGNARQGVFLQRLYFGTVLFEGYGMVNLKRQKNCPGRICGQRFIEDV